MSGPISAITFSILIGLAAWHLLEVPGIDQQQCETTIQDVPDWLPQHTRRLHGHMRHAQRLKVVGQRSQIPGHRPEGADLSKQFPGWLATADSALDRSQMNI